MDNGETEDVIDYAAAAERYEESAAHLLDVEHTYRKRAAKQRRLLNEWKTLPVTAECTQDFIDEEVRRLKNLEAALLRAAESMKLARDLVDDEKYRLEALADLMAKLAAEEGAESDGQCYKPADCA